MSSPFLGGIVERASLSLPSWMAGCPPGRSDPRRGGTFFIPKAKLRAYITGLAMPNIGGCRFLVLVENKEWEGGMDRAAEGRKTITASAISLSLRLVRVLIRA